jgi:hypothetical protein
MHIIVLRLLDVENVDQVLTIHQALVGAPFSVRAERRLVIQGQLSRVVLNTRSMGEERTYILFSDLLAFVRPKVEGKSTKLQYKGHLTLERARVRALTKEEAGGIAHCIEVTSSFAGVDNLNTTFIAAPTVLVLYIGSNEERDEWLINLDRVIDNLDKMALAKHGKIMCTKKKYKILSNFINIFKLMHPGVWFKVEHQEVRIQQQDLIQQQLLHCHQMMIILQANPPIIPTNKTFFLRPIKCIKKMISNSFLCVHFLLLLSLSTLSFLSTFS